MEPHKYILVIGILILLLSIIVLALSAQLFKKDIFKIKPHFVISIWLSLAIFLFFIPWIISVFNEAGDFPTKPNEIGDAIGGMTSPFVGMAAALLTFFAFKVQYEFNNTQVKIYKQDRFDKIFFELINTYKNHSNEIAKSDRNFKTKLKEFNFIHEFTKHYFKTIDFYDISDSEKINLSYQMIYFGISTESIPRIISRFIGIYPNIDKIKLNNYLCSLLVLCHNLNLPKGSTYSYPESAALNKFQLEQNQIKDKVKEYYTDHKIKLELMKGYTSDYSHYYRNLYLIAEHIHLDSINDEIYKDMYFKILRFQLSQEELATLALNAVSSLGENWVKHPITEKNIISNHRILKNIDYNNISSVDSKVLSNYLGIADEESTQHRERNIKNLSA